MYLYCEERVMRNNGVVGCVRNGSLLMLCAAVNTVTMTAFIHTL
jgi:hypothetical protein